MNIKRGQFFLGMFIGLGLLWGIIRFFPDDKLHLIFCNVGQGDAIYIRFPNRTDMLIDGGPDKKVLNCLGKFMPFYDRTIDVIVLTHPEADHFNGLIDVIQRYSMKYFVVNPIDNPEDQLFQKLKQLIEQKQIPIKNVYSGDQIALGNVEADVIWPDKKWLDKESSSDLNLIAINLLFRFRNFSALLTGDADKQIQFQLSQYYHLKKQLNVYKVPHHGSVSSIDSEFIEQIRPQISVIEVGKNSYGHPNIEIIKQLEKWGKVYRTDKDGNIEIVTDGDKIWIK